MKYKVLNTVNPALDRRYLGLLQAFYQGSRSVRANIETLLPQNLSEPDQRYEKRKEQAPYHNYLGPIIDKFAAMLLASPPTPFTVNDKLEQVALDEEWGEWRQDVDGNGCDLTQFFREQFTDSMMKGRSLLAMSLPEVSDEEEPPKNKLEYKERKLGKVRIKELETQDCFDWSTDSAGRLTWLIYHEKDRPRDKPTDDRDLIVETWTVYTREDVQTFQVKYPESKPPKPDDEIPLIKTWVHELGECPIVVLDLPAGLWVADRVYEVQLEHFRIAAALSWALKQSCYAMPMFFLADSSHPPQMGTGLGLILDFEDKVDWLAPPTAHFATMQAEKENLKNEIYRIVHQMADAASNNSGTIGRSGVSKSADLFSTRTILEAFAELVRSSIERTLQMAARLRGEPDIKWTVTGLDQFDDMNLQELITSLQGVEQVGIPSETFDIEVRRMLINALLPNLDEATRSKIFDQLDEGIKAIQAAKKRAEEAELKLKESLAEPQELTNGHQNRNLPPKGQGANAGAGGKGSGVTPPARTNAGGRAGFGRGSSASAK